MFAQLAAYDVTREQFDQAMAGWTVAPVYVDGRLAFATVTKGPEFHYASFGVAPLSLALLRRWLLPLLQQYGYATSRTPKDDRRQQRVNRRLGAEVTGEDEHFVYFRLDK